MVSKHIKQSEFMMQLDEPVSTIKMARMDFKAMYT